MFRYIVPNTSAIAAGLYREAVSVHAAPLLQAIRLQAIDVVAPTLALPEFLNVSRKKQQGNPALNFAPLPAATVEAVVSDFLRLPIIWEELEPLAVNAWRLHQDYGLQTADAFFLEVARVWQAELWTADDPFFTRAIAVYPHVYNLRVQAFV